jgi:hypothetical protein
MYDFSLIQEPSHRELIYKSLKGFQVRQCQHSETSIIASYRKRPSTQPFAVKTMLVFSVQNPQME